MYTKLDGSESRFSQELPDDTNIASPSGQVALHQGVFYVAQHLRTISYQVQFYHVAYDTILEGVTSCYSAESVNNIVQCWFGVSAGEDKLIEIYYDGLTHTLKRAWQFNMRDYLTSPTVYIVSGMQVAVVTMHVSE